MMMRLIIILWLLPCLMCFPAARELKSSPPLFSAMFIFGDSLLDAGNNNYLQSALAKANTLPNGIDFPTHNATGRFCNGKTVTDLIADHAGLNYSLPYLAPTTHGVQLLQGVNFASGAGGILDDSGANYNGRLSLKNQILDLNSTVVELGDYLGAAQAKTFLAESLFVVFLGTNDYIYNYLMANSSTKAQYSDPQQFHTFLASQLKTHLTTMYDLGARKFVIPSLGPFGCIPSRIAVNGSTKGGCVTSDNELAAGFNTAVQKLLPQLTSTLPGAIFLYGDTYSPMLDLIQNPAQLDFEVINRGCCAFGRFKGQVPCGFLNDLTHSLCSNRSAYIFWDDYHPTETVNVVLSQKLFFGSNSDIAPMNIEQLSQWSP